MLNWKGDLSNPLVSVCCTTYNHAPYIEDALEGFLIQKTDFPFEILIHDDASTDQTAATIKVYEEKYPNLIKPVFQKENQYSKGNKPGLINYHRAKGKYIALCEGDDYWIDPEKLQKQVMFLETNPEYSLCVSGFRKLNTTSGMEKDIINVPHGVDRNDNGYSFNLYDTKNGWITKTLTSVFKNEQNVLEQLSKYKNGRDIHLFYHLLKTGRGFYFTEIMGVYQVHGGGIFSMKPESVKTTVAYLVYKELYALNNDEWTRHMYLRYKLHLLNYMLYNEYAVNSLKNKIKWYWESVLLIRNLKEIKHLATVFLSPSFKLKLRK